MPRKARASTSRVTSGRRSASRMAAQRARGRAWRFVAYELPLRRDYRHIARHAGQREPPRRVRGGCFLQQGASMVVRGAEGRCGAPDDRKVHRRSSEAREMVNLTGASSNQIVQCVSQIEQLRRWKSPPGPMGGATVSYDPSLVPRVRAKLVLWIIWGVAVPDRVQCLRRRLRSVLTPEITFIECSGEKRFQIYAMVALSMMLHLNPVLAPMAGRSLSLFDCVVRDLDGEPKRRAGPDDFYGERLSL